jgi:hypothetical protein
MIAQLPWFGATFSKVVWVGRLLDEAECTNYERAGATIELTHLKTMRKRIAAHLRLAPVILDRFYERGRLEKSLFLTTPFIEPI